MKVSRIEIDNVLGHEKLVIEPKAVTVLEGRNGSGKTSALEAIRAAMRGGEDPTMLRKGASEGSVVLTLDDGTVLSRRWRRGKDAKITSTLDVRLPLGVRVSTPRKVVDGLVDELSVDPLALLNCPPAKLAEYLGDVMPLELSPEKLQEAVGWAVPIPKAAPLDQIAMVSKAIYDARTGLNGARKEKLATVAQLEATIPPPAPAGEDSETLRAEREALAREEAKETADATAEAAAARKDEEHRAARAKAQHHEKRDRDLSDIEREEEAAIRAAKDKAAAARAAVEGAFRAELDNVRELLDAALVRVDAGEKSALAEIAAEYGPRLSDLQNRIAAAAERERLSAQAEKTRELLARLRSEAEAHGQESHAHSEALLRLIDLKQSLLASLPIRGLEIREGEVFLDEIPWARVNRARKYEVAVEVAALRAGKLGLLIVDNVEGLDAEAEKALKAAVLKKGMQFVGAKVTDEAFNVTSSDDLFGGEA